MGVKLVSLRNGMNLWEIYKMRCLKKILVIIIALISFCFAEKKCLFDALGNCVTTPFSSFQYITKKNAHKNYYAWSEKEQKNVVKQSYLSMSPRKSFGKKRWYEVDWNQGVKLCPEKNFNTGDGTWVVNGSAHIDSANCVYVDGSPYTRSILVLFARNLNDLTDADSSWILVNQTIVELSKSPHKIWNALRKTNIVKANPESKYVEISFTYDLIVDKTEITLRDALWLEKNGKRVKSKNGYKRQLFYPSRDTLNLLEYPAAYFHLYAEYRSVLDGLNSVMRYNVPLDSVDTNKTMLFHSPNKYNRTVDVYDTAANGYREPSEQEWEALKLGGNQTVFFWGDSADERALGQYSNVACIDENVGVYPVKQFEKNPYGLYDVYGNAEESVAIISGNRVFLGNEECNAFNARYYDIGKACEFLNRYKCNYFDKPWPVARFRSLHHGFQGLRLVRKLE